MLETYFNELLPFIWTVIKHFSTTIMTFVYVPDKFLMLFKLILHVNFLSFQAHRVSTQQPHN